MADWGYQCDYGAFAVTVLLDYRGLLDPYGFKLSATVIAVVDDLVTDELAVGKLAKVPMAIVKGYQYEPSNTAKVRDMIRPPEMDLYR